MSAPTQQSRVPAGVTTGGQFSISVRAESGASITARTVPHRIDVHAKVSVPPVLGQLPPFPATLGEPTLSYVRQVEDNQIELTIHTERTGEVRVWDDGSSFTIGDYLGEEISYEEQTALVAYGRAVRENLDTATFIVEDGVRQAIENDVIAIATGRDPQADRDAHRSSGHLVETSVARTARILDAWVDDVEGEPGTAVQDALTDLIHFSRSRGLNLAEILDAAEHMADVEADEDNDNRVYALEANET